MRRLSPTRIVKSSRQADGTFDFPYDESVQEAVYLAHLGKHFEGHFPEVRNTFLHFDIPHTLGREESPPPDEQSVFRSAPTIILHKSFHTKYPEMEPAHIRKECKPCAYHLYKIDGCRQGATCQFCHLCPPGEIKRHKKEKRKTMKAMAYAARHTTDSSNGADMAVNTQHAGASSSTDDPVTDHRTVSRRLIARIG